MAKETRVLRPVRKTEYEIRFATAQAQKGWRDLCARIRGPLADSWDFLTRTPLETTPVNYPLRGELGVVLRGGVPHQRWQRKPTAAGDARLWFYVEDGVVHLEQAHTRHPNETKKR